MVQIQIKLTNKENKLVNIYKANNELKTKEEAIRRIIRQHLGDETQ